MSRKLTTAAIRSVLAQETDVVWLILLTIKHSDLAEDINVVNNTENVWSRSVEYLGFPFQISLPQEREDRPPQVTLTIDNVDRRIVEAVRKLTSAPTVVLEVITMEDRNTVEVGPYEFSLTEARYDSLTVEGELEFEPVLDEPYPAGRFDPPNFPGLF